MVFTLQSEGAHQGTHFPGPFFGVFFSVEAQATLHVPKPFAFFGHWWF
jgi:hypothetical protein